MKRVLFVIDPQQEGHYAPALVLAAGLRDRDCEVTFAGVQADQARIESRGFAFVTLSSEVFPNAPREHELLAETPGERRSRWQGYFARTEAVGLEFIERARQALSRRFELAICDPIFWEGAWAGALAANWVAWLHTALPHEVRRPSQHRHFPPMSSLQPPTRSLRGRLRNELGWLSAKLALTASDTGSLLAFRHLAHHRVARRLSRAAGCPLRVDYDLVACPRAFDFPSPHRDTAIFGEPLCDLRAASSSSRSRQRPLVYVSLGTTGIGDSAMGERILSSVLALARRLEHVHFVVSRGRPAESSRQQPAQNVELHGWVEQRKLLREASVVLSHGGLNTVKECILARAPMVVCPLYWDQPGNAARVDYHGLGVVLPPSAMTPLALERAVTRCLDGEFDARLESMHRHFSTAQAEQPILKLVSSIA